MMLNYRHKLEGICLTVACLGISLTALSAQTTSVNTVPSGYLTLTIKAGVGGGSSVSVESLPLLAASSFLPSTITGLTANTVTDGNAGWTAGQLSQAATPYLLQITSGTAAGRTFLLSTGTANTATTVTIDPNDAIQTDLTTLGIVVGTDTYRIIPADTISIVFGTPDTTGVLGGAGSPTGVDRVQVLLSNGWNAFYYDTNTNHWRLTTLPHSIGDNVVIRPDTGVVYSRYGTTDLTLILAGQVPSVARQALVGNNGLSVISTGWPIDQTLATSNIQNIPGWISGTSATGVDLVQILTPIGWHQYYYNNSTNHWISASLPHVVSDSVTLPAGSIAYILKQGTTPGTSILSQSVPYSL
jgi:hypothetical protein